MYSPFHLHYSQKEACKSMAEAKKTGTIWSVPFLTILAINFFSSSCQYMIGTILPKYVNALGGTPVIVGFISSAFTVTALLVRPLSGASSDYFRKNRLLTAALAVTLLSYLIYPLTSNIHLIIAARLLDGIGASVKVPIMLAIASDILPEDRISSGIGIYSLMLALASAVGPSICLFAIQTFGYNCSMILVIVMLSAGLLLSLTLKDSADYVRPDHPFRPTLQGVIAKEALLPSLLIIPIAMPYACTLAYIPILGELHGLNSIGLYYTVFSVTLFIARPICGRLADRFDFSCIVIPSLACYAAAMVAIYKASSLTGFIIAAVFGALGYGVSHPCLQSLCMKQVPKNKRGAGSNTYYFGTDIGHLIGPILAGKLIMAFTPGGPSAAAPLRAYSLTFLYLTVPILIALLVVVFYSLAARKKKNAAEC